MSNGRMSEVSSGVFLTELDMSVLIASLTHDLAIIEEDMIIAWRSGKSKLPKLTSHSYVISIKEVVARLRGIASALFNDTEISKVKPYNDQDEVPENYDKYLRVSENLAKLVTQDILYQRDIDHAVAVFERWLYICKIAFHQHDFFTASCILNGLSARGITRSKIESALSETSSIVFRYYRNILEKSSSLYHKQNELIKSKLEVIPTLHVLTNLYEKIGAKPPKGERLSDIQLAEVAIKRRAVSKNFVFMQKNKKLELNDADNLLLCKLYQPFDEVFNILSNDDGEQEKISNFDIRSDALKSLFKNEKTIKRTVSGQDRLPLPSPFSIIRYSKLADSRVELILLWSRMAEMEERYSAPAQEILYNVKSIIANVELTDRIMRHRINDEFQLTTIKLDKKLSKLHKKLDWLLRDLIMHELIYGIKFNAEQLKQAVSSDEVKKRSRKKHHNRHLREISESRAATEEKSDRVIRRPIKLLDIALSDAESESSRTDPKSPLVRQTTDLQLTVASTDKMHAESSAPDMHTAEIVSGDSLSGANISTSLQLLKSFNRFDPPIRSDSCSLSVRSELDELLSARSVNEAKKAYTETVSKSGGTLTLQQEAPSLQPERKVIEPAPSKESVLDGRGGGMRVQRFKQ